MDSAEKPAESTEAETESIEIKAKEYQDTTDEAKEPDPQDPLSGEKPPGKEDEDPQGEESPEISATEKEPLGNDEEPDNRTLKEEEEIKMAEANSDEKPSDVPAPEGRYYYINHVYYSYHSTLKTDTKEPVSETKAVEGPSSTAEGEEDQAEPLATYDYNYESMYSKQTVVNMEQNTLQLMYPLVILRVIPTVNSFVMFMRISVSSSIKKLSI